jgi:UDP-N-acetylmuramyl tripeptide synthase
MTGGGDLGGRRCLVRQGRGPCGGARAQPADGRREGRGIRLLSRTPTQLGQTLEIERRRGQRKTRKVNLPLIGAYQAANALVRPGWCWPRRRCGPHVRGARRLQPVRGRLERAAISRAGAPVYVDYAHTPMRLRPPSPRCART